MAVTEKGLTHSINTLKDAIQLWAGLLAKKKIKVFFRGTDCFATPTTITLPELSLLETKNPTKERLIEVAEYLEAVRGQVVHEVSHHMFSDFDVPEINAFRRLSAMHDAIYNVCEDLMSESMMVESWPGTKTDLRNLNEWAHRQHVEPAMWASMGAFARTLFAWSAFTEFGENYWYFSGQADSVKAVVQMLSEESEKIKQARNSRDALAVAQSLVKKLETAAKTPPKPQPKPQPDQKKSPENKQPQDQKTDQKKGGKSAPGKGASKKTEGKGASKTDKPGKSGTKKTPTSGESKAGAEAKTRPTTPTPPSKDDSASGPGNKIEDANTTGLAIERAFKDQAPGKLPDRRDLLAKFAKDDVSKPHMRGDRYTVYSTQHDQLGHVDVVRPPKSDSALTVERYKYRLLSGASEEISGVFRRKMRNLLTEDSRPLRYHEQEEGDLDMEHLYRVLIPQTTGRVFYRETQQSDTKDVAVMLVINQSGSMVEQGFSKCDLHGPPTDARCQTLQKETEKLKKNNPGAAPFRCPGHLSKFKRIDLARQTALIFGETLSALGTAFKIVGHNAYVGPYTDAPGVDTGLYTRRGVLSMPVFKDWDQQWDRVKHTLMRLVAEGNTYDGEALVRAARDISKRREKRKIIFMLDDGIPEPVRESKEAHRAYFYRSIREVIAAGIEVIGLGMAVDEIKKYYPTCVVIENVDDTPRVAGTELRRALTRKPRESRYT